MTFRLIRIDSIPMFKESALELFVFSNWIIVFIVNRIVQVVASFICFF